MKILEIINHCNVEKLDVILISFDFEKAFDSVEWQTIFHTLDIFNFGPGIIQMIKVLFARPQICAYNNGYLSEFKEITRGCRQGCCLSPIIFIYVVEILGLSIRQNNKIEGIQIGDSYLKSGQFADDLWASLLAKESNLAEMLKLLDKFRFYAGLRIHPGKCAILKLGPWRNTEARFYTMKKMFWSPKTIKILGFVIIADANALIQENFRSLLDKVDCLTEAWNTISLTLIGKITVINVGVSRGYTDHHQGRGHP